MIETIGYSDPQDPLVYTEDQVDLMAALCLLQGARLLRLLDPHPLVNVGLSRLERAAFHLERKLFATVYPPA